MSSKRDQPLHNVLFVVEEHSLTSYYTCTSIYT